MIHTINHVQCVITHINALIIKKPIYITTQDESYNLNFLSNF